MDAVAWPGPEIDLGPIERINVFDDVGDGIRLARYGRNARNSTRRHLAVRLTTEQDLWVAQFAKRHALPRGAAVRYAVQQMVLSNPAMLYTPD